MVLNATMLVQFINFFIAYLLIDRILLRKAVSIIDQNRREKAELMEKIQHERELVNDRQALKVEKWSAMRKVFAKHAPKKQEFPEIKIPEVSLKVSMEPGELDRCCDRVETMLIKRVADGIR
jgi:hypothetical protein